MRIYNKLVRDKIIDLIKTKGEPVVYRVATDLEYQQKLHEKLAEECQEFGETPTLEEMADLLEVVDALKQHYGFDEGELQRIKEKKREEKGGFTERLILEQS